MENLFRLVHDWHPETNVVLATMKSDDMKERMSVLKKRGGTHNYREFYIEESDNGYHFMVYDSCHHNRQEIVFDADDYMNGGVPGMYAFVSPDKKYVYVVGDILANSTGWVSTFIIYQVNTETLKAKLVNAVAAIKLDKTGFTVASMTRCVTPDNYISSAMDFAFEDITYGFNVTLGTGTSVTSSGNVTAVPVPSVTLKNLGALRSGPRCRIRLRQE
jgi:hypothetical protein